MKETLYLFNSDYAISKNLETIECSKTNEDGTIEKNKIPAERLDTIEIYGNAVITNPLFELSNKYTIPIYMNTYYGNPIGQFIPESESLNIVRLSQYESFLNITKKLHIAKAIVKKAMQERIRILKKFGKTIDISNEITIINNFQDKIDSIDSITSLRGIEGNYMKAYFDGFTKLLKNLEFNGRTQQPPKDTGNAILSWGNVILYNKVRSIIYKTGLDTKLGFLHDPHDGRDSLAIDISEIFRPIIIDNLILRLDHKSNLMKSHFEIDEVKCYLNQDGKKIWIREFNDFLTSSITYPPLSRRIAIHEEIKIEAYNLIKYLNGEKEKYIPIEFDNG